MFLVKFIFTMCGNSVNGGLGAGVTDYGIADSLAAKLSSSCSD